jgi:hypothetical protein
LNGNNQTQVGERFEHEATPPGSPSTSGYRNMGSIIKGSVMDKVTNVFSGQTMGNSSNKEAATAGASAVAKPSEVGNAINIPKGETLFSLVCVSASLLLQFISVEYLCVTFASIRKYCVTAQLLHYCVTMHNYFTAASLLHNYFTSSSVFDSCVTLA